MTFRGFMTIAATAAALPFATCLAAELPPIKTTDKNTVPECATPGRMMAFIKSRNASLDPRFEKIAVHYMREGEELGVRWDYAIAQMAIETNYLSYRAAGGRRGDVSPSQNNFAGLGATGRGAPGESFKDVQTGVRAHLQHLLMYAGDTVEEPVAERTRKVMEWGVLKSFHAKIKGPVTFKHLANKWAISSDYASAIETHADRFYSDFCSATDPNPELVAEARPPKRAKPVDAASADEKPEKRVAGLELARRAIDEGKAERDDARRGLGAAKIAKPAEAEEAAKAPVKPSFTVLNAPRPEPESKPEKPTKPEQVAMKPEKPAAPEKPVASEKPAAPEKAAVKAEKPAVPEKPAAAEKPTQFVAAAAGGIAAKALMPVGPGTKCRVWTASYGGQRAIIIRSQSDGAVNYTVLDVNEGAEKREAEAYISAYAKGGVVAAEFQSQTQALDKAFELCPEG